MICDADCPIWFHCKKCRFLLKSTLELASLIPSSAPDTILLYVFLDVPWALMANSALSVLCDCHPRWFSSLMSEYSSIRSNHVKCHFDCHPILNLFPVMQASEGDRAMCDCDSRPAVGARVSLFTESLFENMAYLVCSWLKCRSQNLQTTWTGCLATQSCDTAPNEICSHTCRRCNSQYSFQTYLLDTHTWSHKGMSVLQSFTVCRGRETSKNCLQFLQRNSGKLIWIECCEKSRLKDTSKVDHGLGDIEKICGLRNLAWWPRLQDLQWESVANYLNEWLTWRRWCKDNALLHLYYKYNVITQLCNIHVERFNKFASKPATTQLTQSQIELWSHSIACWSRCLQRQWMHIAEDKYFCRKAQQGHCLSRTKAWRL